MIAKSCIRVAHLCAGCEATNSEPFAGDSEVCLQADQCGDFAGSAQQAAEQGGDLQVTATRQRRDSCQRQLLVTRIGNGPHDEKRDGILRSNTGELGRLHIDRNGAAVCGKLLFVSRVANRLANRQDRTRFDAMIRQAIADARMPRRGHREYFSLFGRDACR